jgi:GR25 family glycosyltransferase involved in LPS biosynthesis
MDALSHLSAIYYAKQHKLKNVLVFEDDIIVERANFLDFSETIRSLSELDLNLFYLGANIEVHLGRRLGSKKSQPYPLTNTYTVKHPRLHHSCHSV